MKNYLLSSVFTVAFIFSSQADIIYPDGSTPQEEPYAIKKLARGLSSIILAPIEFPRAMLDVSQDKEVTDFEQFSLAIFRGPYKMGLRYASGFYDIGTFADDETPLLHLEPQTLSPLDALPGYNSQFSWGNLNSPWDH